MNYDGRVTKFRDSVLTKDFDYEEACMYKVVCDYSHKTWNTEEPFDRDNKEVIRFECRVRVGEIQSRSLGLKVLEPPPRLMFSILLVKIKCL